jgi:hypothetical protein
VIGEDARIVLTHVDPDYRERLEPEAALARLRTLAARPRPGLRRQPLSENLYAAEK